MTDTPKVKTVSPTIIPPRDGDPAPLSRAATSLSMALSRSQIAVASR